MKTGIKANLPDGPPSSDAPGDPAQAWRDLRADPDIQFSEIDIPREAPEPPPDWLLDFMKWLSDLFAPLAAHW